MQAEHVSFESPLILLNILTFFMRATRDISGPSWSRPGWEAFDAPGDPSHIFILSNK